MMMIIIIDVIIIIIVIIIIATGHHDVDALEESRAYAKGDVLIILLILL